MLDGEARSLLNNEEVREIYLGKGTKNSMREGSRMNHKRSPPYIL